MALLFDEDYDTLTESGLEWEEDEDKRFLVIKNYPLPCNFYVHNGATVEQIEVLCVIPPDYNSNGGDMFWVNPALVRADGKAIPNAACLVGRILVIIRTRNTVDGLVTLQLILGSQRLTIYRRFSVASNGH